MFHKNLLSLLGSEKAEKQTDWTWVTCDSVPISFHILMVKITPSKLMLFAVSETPQPFDGAWDISFQSSAVAGHKAARRLRERCQRRDLWRCLRHSGRWCAQWRWGNHSGSEGAPACHNRRGTDLSWREWALPRVMNQHFIKVSDGFFPKILGPLACCISCRASLRPTHAMSLAWSWRAWVWMSLRLQRTLTRSGKQMTWTTVTKWSLDWWWACAYSCLGEVIEDALNLKNFKGNTSLIDLQNHWLWWTGRGTDADGRRQWPGISAIHWRLCSSFGANCPLEHISSAPKFVLVSSELVPIYAEN